MLSHYSYLIGSRGEAMIVDPARDISRYLKDAQELGPKITKVYLTHSHADFVAGHMELAKGVGANPYEYIHDVYDRIIAHPANRLHELLPAEWMRARANR